MSSLQTGRAGSVRGIGTRLTLAFRRRKIARTPIAIAAWLALAFFLFVVVFGPLLVSADPVTQDAAPLLFPGSPGHLLGTDELGRDQLSRIVHGAAPLVSVALLATLFACVVGVAIGLLAGFLGGWVDQILMRFTDVGLAFPSILIIVLTVTVAGSNASALIIGIGIAMIPSFARLSRALAAREAVKDYVLAAKLGGASLPRILTVEIMPNLLGPVLVQIVSTISVSAGFAAGLSYLGLGIQPPQPDWGYMVQAGQEFIYTAPRLVIIPAICTVAFVAACNFVGDDLRDALDPRTQQ